MSAGGWVIGRAAACKKSRCNNYKNSCSGDPAQPGGKIDLKRLAC